MEPVDIASIKENTEDLNIDKSQVGGLDSLLNIGANAQGPSISGDNFKFITPAEGLVKEESTKKEEKSDGDYFKPVDNDSFTEAIPEAFMSAEDEQYSIDTAIEKIKELVEDLKAHGIELKTDEMNFEKSYQVIIKLAK